MNIYPSILERTYQSIEKKISRIAGLVTDIQIDICDGVFVPSKTYASNGRIDSLKKIKKQTKGYNLELDLMVDFNNTDITNRWMHNIKTIKPERIILHASSTDNWGQIFKELIVGQSLVTTIGLGVSLADSNKEIIALMESYPFSFIQVMGIERVGYSGQKFSPQALTKIKTLRKRLPQVLISVDGGVKIENASQIKQAGATTLCPNSGLFSHPDIKKALQEFKSA